MGVVKTKKGKLEDGYSKAISGKSQRGKLTSCHLYKRGRMERLNEGGCAPFNGSSVGS